jgi:hypothetical protein
VYVGTANKLPDYLIPATAIIKTSAAAPTSEEVVSLGKAENLNGKKDAQNTSLSVVDGELVGNWGTLNGPNISWQDESTGYTVVSGLSKGHGLELKADGAYVQSTVVTSGRPNYRVYVSTTGRWAAEGDRLKFYPTDLHYRKWENEIIMIDEHSIPEAYEMFWQIKINEFTGKQCLYTKYESDSTYNELCIE